MAKKDIQNIAIIGGGYSGLAVASLLAHHGYMVNLFEAHTYLGGCASFFKRGKFKFDCGATTLSGLLPGRPLNKLIKILTNDNEALQNTIHTLHLENPMKVHLNSGKIIERHRDFDLFLEELKNHFPQADHRAFWTKMRLMEQRLWEVLGAGQHFPPKNIKDLTHLFKPSIISKADLALAAFFPLKNKLPPQYPQEMIDFINEQLLISTIISSVIRLK